MDVPRLGMEWELKLPAYTTAIATPDLRRSCDLHHHPWQRWIPNPLSKATDWTCILTDTSWVHYCRATIIEGNSSPLKFLTAYKWFDSCPNSEQHRHSSKRPLWVTEEEDRAQGNRIQAMELELQKAGTRIQRVTPKPSPQHSLEKELGARTAPKPPSAMGTQEHEWTS